MHSHDVPGLLCIGTAPAIIVNAPLIMPEVPIPETARPTINIFEEFETPQMSDPSSNTAMKLMKTIYTC
jgi:hypothetical protein